MNFKRTTLSLVSVMAMDQPVERLEAFYGNILMNDKERLLKIELKVCDSLRYHGVPQTAGDKLFPGQDSILVCVDPVEGHLHIVHQLCGGHLHLRHTRGNHVWKSEDISMNEVHCSYLDILLSFDV